MALKIFTASEFTIGTQNNWLKDTAFILMLAYYLLTTQYFWIAITKAVALQTVLQFSRATECMYSCNNALQNKSSYVALSPILLKYVALAEYKIL